MQPVCINRAENWFTGLCTCESICLEEGEKKPLSSSGPEWIVMWKFLVRGFSDWSFPSRGNCVEFNIAKARLPCITSWEHSSTWEPEDVQNPSLAAPVALSLVVPPGTRLGSWCSPTAVSRCDRGDPALLLGHLLSPQKGLSGEVWLTEDCVCLGRECCSKLLQSGSLNLNHIG